MPDRGKAGSLSEIFTRDFLLLSTINLTMFFGFQMTNVGLPVYVALLGANAQTVGLIGTVMTITAVVVRAFAGPLLDRFGRKGALVGGSLIMVVSIISYAIFPIVGVIVGVRLLQGIGWGLGSTASSTMAADVIPKRRFAEGMGYFALTNSLSSALAPAVSIALVQGADPSNMVYVAAGCTALAFVLALFQRNTVKAQGPTEKPLSIRPAASSHDDPEDSSSSPNPDNPRSSSDTVNRDASDGPHGPSNPSRPDDLGSASNPGGHCGPPPSTTPSSTLDAIFERRAAFPGFLMLLVNVGFGCITSFIALHGLEQGVVNVSIYFITYAVVTLASRPLIGRLIDRYGYRMPSILSCLGTVLTLVFIGISHSTLMFACAGALAGLGVGTAMSVFQAMAVAAVEPWRRGVATSTYFIAFDIGIAIGSLIGGLIAGALGFTAMYIIVAVFPLAAGILSAALIKNR